MPRKVQDCLGAFSYGYRVSYSECAFDIWILNGNILKSCPVALLVDCRLEIEHVVRAPGTEAGCLSPTSCSDALKSMFSHSVTLHLGPPVQGGEFCKCGLELLLFWFKTD